jgi:hypothetical protein
MDPGNAVRPTPRSRRRHTTIAALAVGTVVAVLTATWADGAMASPPTVGAAAAAATSGTITGYGGLCLDDKSASTTNKNPVDVYTCNGTAAQTWTESGGNLLVLGKCLGPTGGGTASGTVVDIYDCNGTAAQVWQSQSNGELLNTNSGECLTDPGNGGSGTQLQIATCTDAANQKWVMPTGGGTTSGLNPGVAPGGNFNLSLWELQLPTGSAGDPTTILPSQLEGDSGFQDSYFYTGTDGSMTFWDPENGVTTANSNFSRSELREMTSSGAAANWFAAGTTNKLSATVKATTVPSSVAVGQIHLGSGGSTKPLLELFYHSDGEIVMAIEQTPAGGNEVSYDIASVPLGTEWSYTIGLAGSTISLSINGGTARTWTASSTFNGYGMYFKAGDYDQTSGSSSTVGARVEFYALSISHN